MTPDVDLDDSCPAAPIPALTRSRTHPVVAVVGATGGVGASSLCVALAAVAARQRTSRSRRRRSRRRSGRPGEEPEARQARGDAGPPICTLIDLDDLGGGADLLVGAEDSLGSRWSDLRLGGGTLDPSALAGRVPTVRGVGVLACDPSASLAASDVAQVLRAARQHGPVIVDVPRWLPGHARPAIEEADVVVLLAPSEIRSVAAAGVLLPALAGFGSRAPAVVLRPGALIADYAADILGRSEALVLPVDDWFGGDSSGALDLGAVPMSIVDVAEAIWVKALPRQGAG